MLKGDGPAVRFRVLQDRPHMHKSTIIFIKY